MSIPFVIDGPRFEIYGGELAQSRVIWLHEILRSACDEVDVGSVDLTERFATLHRETGVRFESAYDPHWNEEGHRQAALATLEKLREMGL